MIGSFAINSVKGLNEGFMPFRAVVRRTFRSGQKKIPLSPFTKGVLNFERIGMVAQFMGEIPAGAKRSPF